MKNLVKHLGLESRIVIRLAVAVVLFSSLITLIITGLQVYTDYRKGVTAINETMQQAEHTYVPSLTKSVWVVDEEQIQTLLLGILQLPDVVYLEIKVDNRAKWFAGTPRFGNIISKTVPLIQRYEGRDLTLGVFTIEATLDNVYERLLNRVVVILLGNGAKTFLVVGFIFFVFQYLVTRHLGGIARYLNNLELGNSGAPLVLDRPRRNSRKPDELDEVVIAINRMRKNLDGSYAALRESEARFRAFTENSPTKIHIKDTKGRYILINPQSEKLFGVTNEQARGKTSADIFPREMGEDFSTHDREVLATGRVSAREEVFQAKGGALTFLTVKFPIRDGAGETVAVGAIGTDITDRKRADNEIRSARGLLETRVEERTRELTREIAEHENTERALRESEQRFRDIAGIASDWFWEMGPDLRVSYISDRYMDITGRPQEDYLGKTRWEIAKSETDEVDDEKMREHRRQLERHEPFRGFDYPVRGSDGQTIHVRLSGMPVYDAHGEFKGYRGTGTDITERKLAEQALVDAKEQAEQANMAKSHFLANMSHELRTPLNAIIGFTDAIRQAVFGPLKHEKYAEYVDNIFESGTHLLQLINDILDVSAIEAERMELREEVFDVAGVIESAVLSVRTKAETGQVKLVNEMNFGLPRLYADERRVKQILINLLTNAVKFTLEGGQVTVHAGVDGSAGNRDGLEIRVADTGIGMAPDKIPTAMAPFGQIDSTIARQQEGTGLGLHLSRNLSSLHGGSLEIESEEGQGTTVTVRFPRWRVIVG